MRPKNEKMSEKTPGEFLLRLVKAVRTTPPTPSSIPAPKQQWSPAEGIHRIRAGRETAALICGPGGSNFGLLVLIQR